MHGPHTITYHALTLLQVYRSPFSDSSSLSLVVPQGLCTHSSLSGRLLPQLSPAHSSRLTRTCHLPCRPSRECHSAQLLPTSPPPITSLAALRKLSASCLFTYVLPVSPSRRYRSRRQGFCLPHILPSAPGIEWVHNKPWEVQWLPAVSRAMGGKTRCSGKWQQEDLI